MRCEDALRAVVEARYAGEDPPAEALERLRHADCHALRERSAKLDALLALDEAHEAGPGFDTRFFARLEAERGGSKRRAPLLLGALGALGASAVAAAIVAVTLNGTEPEGTTQPAANVEVAMLRDLELLENYEVVAQLDEVETFELLAAVDVETLDRMIEEEER